MILEEATKEAFGYYSSELASESHKRVVSICDKCGDVKFPENRRSFQICTICARKNNLGWSGRRHTKESKQKMSDSMKGNKARLGCTHTEEAKQKMSAAKKGKNHPNFGKHGKYTSGWKGGPVNSICVYCGNEFWTEKGRAKNGYGKYCCLACKTKGKTGENNPNWRGGISFGRYCIKFNSSYKRKIRNRFSNKCFLCGKTQKENGRALDVHHVNYNKACGCDDTKCICVPLCTSCHSKTNFNRSDYQKKITNMLLSTFLGY